ncbi:MAG: CotH kinase family protein [Bacteroidales bacterium]|nr:CotH kinase family protein [Candidatus Sodaliphilus aphodohippi]
MDKKHLAFVLALMIIGLNAYSQIFINGHRTVLDSITNNLLCPVKRSAFGVDLRATVTFEQDTTPIIIEGTTVHSGDVYTFESIEANKEWIIDTDEGTRYLTFTYLPVLVLNGNFGMEYSNATLQWLDPNDYDDIPFTARVKWRGGSTNTFKSNKRNFHIKLIDSDGNKAERSFMGLRNDNSWILDAGQIDFFRMRNRVATELWNDLCHKPYYADKEPKALSGVRGKMIEVFVNNRYNGCYAFTEAMDRKELKLKKFNAETGEIHGQLWKGKDLTTITAFNDFMPYDNLQETWYGFETKYPELKDISPLDYSILGNAVLFGDTCSIFDFNSKADNYFDMPVMIDYNILLQVLMGIDNYGKNIYWCCYDRNTDKRLSLAVWDFDVSMGNCWDPKDPHPFIAQPTYDFEFPNGIFEKISSAQSIYWKPSVKRYRELRHGVLDPENLKQRYIDAFNNLNDCGAVEREQQRWSRNSDLSGKPLDIKAELNYICNWIDQRIDFIDNNFFVEPLNGDVNNDKVVDIADLNDLINIILSYGKDGIMANASGDINGDGIVDIADVSSIINIILNIRQQYR